MYIEFKEGDVIFVEGANGCCDYIEIFKNDEDGNIFDYASYNMNDSELDYSGIFNINKYDYNSIRFATQEERRRLFLALKKEGKMWDYDKKQILNLPSKYTFKAFDKVLVRDTRDERWRPAFFASFDKNCINEYTYGLIGDSGEVYCKYCIPYNDQTAHLLGTTDYWE